MESVSEFTQFADDLHARRLAVASALPDAIAALGAALGATGRASLVHANALLVEAMAALEDAEHELRSQSDALFCARVEMDVRGAEYRELFDTAPVAFLTTTADARITRANAAASSMLGRPLNALAGRMFAGFVAHGEQAAYRTALRRTRASRHVEEWPIRLVPSDAPERECRVRVRARRSAAACRPIALDWVIIDAADDVYGVT